jgi:hypothetical protein
MDIKVRRYVIFFGALNVAAGFVSMVLILALPQFVETISEIFGMPMAFGISMCTSYYFIFRNRRLPSKSEYWRMVVGCTLIGVGLGFASMLVFGRWPGTTAGDFVLFLVLGIGLQFLLLAFAFSGFLAKQFQKAIEQSARKQGGLGE